jgi:hypothetical protein
MDSNDWPSNGWQYYEYKYNRSLYKGYPTFNHIGHFCSLDPMNCEQDLNFQVDKQNHMNWTLFSDAVVQLIYRSEHSPGEASLECIELFASFFFL